MGEDFGAFSTSRGRSNHIFISSGNFFFFLVKTSEDKQIISSHSFSYIQNLKSLGNLRYCKHIRLAFKKENQDF